MNTIPMNWAVTNAIEIAEPIRGVTYKKENARLLPTEGFTSVLRANNIQGNRIDQSDLVYVPDENISKNQRLLIGDVIVAMSSGSISVVGKSAQVLNDINASFGAFCGALRPTNEVVPAYLGHFLKTEAYRSAISTLARGVNINNIKWSHFEEIELPLAPLSEQKRIADKLDTVLARVDACRERLNRVSVILKRFRQSVLAAATSGDLSTDWRALHKSAPQATVLHDLLRSDHEIAGGHARGNASLPTEDAHTLVADDLPTGWEVAELRDVCRPGRPITYGILKPGPELEEGVPYIRVADFPGNKLQTEGIKRTSREIDEQFRRARLIPGDLLLSIRGSVGRLVSIPAELDGANITQDTARLSISNRLNVRYVYFSLLSEGIQTRIKNATRGVAVRGINIGDVRALQIPLPSVEEQNEIVRRVETLFAFATRLETRLATARVAVERLTPALLAKAFRGELVPQDPNDEPASELLKRLAAGRAADSANRGRKRSAKA